MARQYLFWILVLSFPNLAHASVKINSLDIAFIGLYYNGSLHIEFDGVEVASGVTNFALDSHVTSFTTNVDGSGFSVSGDILLPTLSMSVSSDDIVTLETLDAASYVFEEEQNEITEIIYSATQVKDYYNPEVIVDIYPFSNLSIGYDTVPNSFAVPIPAATLFIGAALLGLVGITRKR